MKLKKQLHSFQTILYTAILQQKNPRTCKCEFQIFFQDLRVKLFCKTSSSQFENFSAAEKLTLKQNLLWQR